MEEMEGEKFSCRQYQWDTCMTVIYTRGNANVGSTFMLQVH